MNEVYLEQRMIHSSTALTKDLARHLFTRGRQGKVAIVTDNPSGLHAALRKQWAVLLRQVQRERSSTLQAARIQVLSDQLSWMQRLSFTQATPDEKPADVHVLSARDYLASTSVFEAVYITDNTPTPPEQFISRMERGIVVAYSYDG